jgi:YHS domain-containing protein
MLARLFSAALLAAGMALSASPGLAEVNVQGGSFAIEGYDPVAYFSDGTPTEGSEEFAAEYDGATWLFASAENRDAFLADPEKYAPAYGGYCATGMSFGERVPVDPVYWRIIDGRLYLNNSNAAQQFFLQDVPGNISRADANWVKIKDVPADEL